MITGLGGALSSEVGQFARIEEKYLVSKAWLRPLEELLAFRLRPAYPDPETSFTGVESVYFDSSDLQLFQHHFLRPARRFKLRSRRYAPDGRWESSSVFLELKEKRDRVTYKSRLSMDPETLDRWVSGGEVSGSARLLDLNPGLRAEAMRERLARIDRAVLEFGLQPRCRIRYKRLAFERGPIRVTLDSEIEVTTLGQVPRMRLDAIRSSVVGAMAREMRSRLDPERYVILEIKHAGSVPVWLSRFLEERGATDVSFSKYCYGMSQSLD